MEEFPKTDNSERERWKKIGGLDELRKLVASKEWNGREEREQGKERTPNEDSKLDKIEEGEEIALSRNSKLDEINRALNLNLSDQELEIIKRELPDVISKMLERGRDGWDSIQKNRWSYRNILENAIASGKTDLSDEACSGYVLDAILGNSGEATSDDEISTKVRIAEAIVRENADKLIFKGGELEHFMAKDKQAKQEAIKSSIFHGTFPTGAANEPNEEARKLLRESDIDSNRIMRNAFLGYAKSINSKDHERLEAYDNFFGLSNRLIQMMDESYSGLFRANDGEFYLKAGSELNPQWYKNDKITKGIRRKLKEKYSQMLSELVDRYRGKPELARETESALEKIPEAEQKNFVREIANTPKKEINFGRYFSIKTVTLSGEMSERIMHDIRDDGYRIVSDETLAKTLLKDKTIDIDYRQIWQNTLKQCLGEGCRLGHSKNDIRYLTEIFETESFKENQTELGIDFEDPEIFELAFTGFINVLKTQNGEKSAAADWYYENIFANNPGEFLAMVHSLRENSDDRGVKGKLTGFFKHNSQAFEDKVRAEVEKRLDENIKAERHAIKSSILREAKRGDIRKIIEAHKRNFVSRMQKRLPDEISTFTGERTIDSGEGEPDKTERKEAPFDFGYDKARTMERWADYIEEVFPNCNLKWFVDFFPGEDGKSFADTKNSDIDSSIWESEESYFGFSFEYDGKRCVIANSLNANAAMYLWRGELDEGFKELFDNAKYDTKRTSDPKIADIDHLSKENFDDSLELAYKKAFLFFKTGDNTLMHYNHFKGNSRERREQWHLYQQTKFPAFPLGVDNYEQYPDDISGYREWQTRQAKIEERLKTAMKAGGPEMARQESERIARENAERLYNEALAST